MILCSTRDELCVCVCVRERDTRYKTENRNSQEDDVYITKKENNQHVTK